MHPALINAVEPYRRNLTHDHILHSVAPRLYPLRPPSERHLQCVWFDDAIRPSSLTTTSGECVRVISPGRWNAEAGPDFLDAVLEIGTEHRRLAGDIEVHINPSEWDSHAHAMDPAYARVIAHVTFFEGRSPKSLPVSTVSIPLKEPLLSLSGFFFEAIDTTEYPYANRRNNTPCSHVLKTFDQADIRALLAAAGFDRIMRKAERFAAALDTCTSEQLIYRETLAALGYKHNQTLCRRLASLLPFAVLREHAGGNVDDAYAMLLGSAGLLPQSRPHWPPQAQHYVRLLWKLWWRKKSLLDIDPLHAYEWKRSGVRPQNAPIRRLAAAAALFTAEPPLAGQLEAIGMDSPLHWRRNAEQLIKNNARMPYWDHLLSFAGTPQSREVALLGTQRIAAVMVNVFLPFLAARGVNIVHLAPEVPREHRNSLQAEAAYALFGHDHAESLYPSALHQQGLIQILHDFCIADHSGCAECRFPNQLRLQKTCNSQTLRK